MDAWERLIVSKGNPATFPHGDSLILVAEKRLLEKAFPLGQTSSHGAIS